MTWWCALALAQDPLLAGVDVPSGTEISIERGAERWTVRVGAQTLHVSPPRTPEEESAVRALVASLASRLDLSTEIALPALPPPRPAPRPPPPPPLAAPVTPPPVVQAAPVVPAAAPASPVWAVWVGPEVVLRPGWAAGGGLALGATVGDRRGVGAVASARAPRAAFDATAWEVGAAVELWTALRPGWSVAGGGGAVVRRWVADGPVALHVLPRAHTRLTAVLGRGPLAGWIGAGAELDLGTTWVGPAGGLQQQVSPIAGQLFAGIGPRGGRR